MQQAQLPITKAQIIAYKMSNLRTDVAWMITAFIASISAQHGAAIRARIYKVMCTVGTLCCVLLLNNIQKQAHIEGILDGDVSITNELIVAVPSNRQLTVSFYHAFDKYMSGVIIPYIHPKVTLLINNIGNVAIVSGTIVVGLVLMGKLFATIMLIATFVVFFLAWRIVSMALPPA